MGLPDSRRQAALADLLNRLSFIQVAKGYHTDAGRNIFQAEAPRMGSDDPEVALLVQVGDDTPETQGRITRTVVPFEVWAIVPVGSVKPLTVIERIIADIREAVEIETEKTDRYLGTVGGGVEPATTGRGLTRGVTRGTSRLEGTDFIGAAVEYLATFEEPWGGPS